MTTIAATTPIFAPSGAFTMRSMSLSMGSLRRRGRFRALRGVEDGRREGEVDDVELPGRSRRGLGELDRAEVRIPLQRRHERGHIFDGDGLACDRRRPAL